MLGFGERGVVIPIGLDVGDLRVRTDGEGGAGIFPGLEGCRVVLFLSRLDRKKGLEILLESFAHLSAGASDLRLLIGGDGEAGYLEVLKRRAADLGLEGKVIWAGFLEGETKRAALRCAAVYCLPSYSENFGIAAVEAMAAGIPCVFTEGVGIAAEAESAGAAVVVPPESPRLSAAIGALLEDGARGEEMGKRGRAWAERAYSLAGMGVALKALYRGEWEVLGKL